jgi:pilus assembly protein Flp/PilA
MKNLTTAVVRFLTSEDGPTAVEYAMMLALIIAVCFTAITTVGASTNKVFSNSALKAAAS